MGENTPAANQKEIQKIANKYFEINHLEIVTSEQVDPDASVFLLHVNGESMFLLEEDYLSDVEGVIARFTDYGVANPVLVQLLSPPSEFDYETSLKARPEYFTEEDDDYNRLRLYGTYYQPRKLKYQVRYFLAKAGNE